MTFIADFAQKLKHLRAKHNLLIEQLSAISNISPSTLKAIENAENVLSYNLISKLAIAFKNDADELLVSPLGEEEDVIMDLIKYYVRNFNDVVCDCVEDDEYCEDYDN